MSRDIVNTIRARVGLDPVPAGNAQQMLDIILNERRLELAYEAQRWDDLVRYGKAVSTMTSLQEMNLITGEYVDYNANENTLILPIPIDELDRNPNLIQNPGY
ncbi:MAG: RagB/SusD family nutrient uptake outer membrane protein [Bacteroidales bacterium]|nr:RagB/SusD family nutrient uptake outer membrane protein [Bacteroidales bacterium]